MPFRVLQLVTAPIRLSGRLLQFSLTVAATPFRMLAPGKHRRDLVEQTGGPVPGCSCAQNETHPGMYSATDVQAMLGMVKEALRAKVIQIPCQHHSCNMSAMAMCRTPSPCHIVCEVKGRQGWPVQSGHCQSAKPGCTVLCTTSLLHTSSSFT